MIVRQIKPEEIDVTVTLTRYYAQECAESMPRIAEEYDVNSAIQTIRTRTIQPQSTWLNMYDNGRPVGFVSGIITTAPWNNEVVFSVIDLFYIHKSHRNMENFRQLIAGFEEWAAQFNSQTVFVSDMGVNTDRTFKVFEFIGYKPATSLIKEL